MSGQSGFAACPPLRKLLKPSGEQALRPDFISFPGVLNNDNNLLLNQSADGMTWADCFPYPSYPNQIQR
jgi:hypothetical protein